MNAAASFFYHHAVFAALQKHPVLKELNLQQLLQFIRLAARVKNDILLCQPFSVSSKCAPDVLPPSIISFLSEATNIPPEHIDSCWEVLKDDVWQFPSVEEVTQEDEQAFVNYGWARGLCNVRTYYDGVPDYLKVGDHQYVERKLAAMWISLMLLAWVSATNCAKTYDMSLSEKQTSNIEAGGWQFGTLLTTDHVWDSFVILTLLDLHKRNNTRLQVLHTGDQKDRFTAAMQERNEYIIQYGQDEAGHFSFVSYCRASPHSTHLLLSQASVISLSVTASTWDFRAVDLSGAPILLPTAAIASVRIISHSTVSALSMDATNLVAPDTKTCTLPAHSKMERLHNERGKAAFTLKERLQKHRKTHPSSKVAASDGHVEADEDGEDDIETFEIDGTGGVRMHTEKHPGSIGVVDTPDVDECEAKKAEAGNRRFKAKLGRQRTHNEQTLIRPCGVFHARATMYGAEAVSNVLLFVQAAFSVPAAYKPEHLVYDTNCDAKQQVNANPVQWAWFKDMGMCVDVWHFLNKHAVTHQFCQEHCNPADYPELLGPDGKWFFNKSVAEQTNVWLGGYHSMCREMLPVKYNFFLDEMIRLRNEAVVAKLAQDGHEPRRHLLVQMCSPTEIQFIL
ncbi:hypothetical protein B0H14DRAFT_3755558 [Mycena olivaceomarginata]|nr:hypothetical protein B0H14DRAFT_3755558 [Mycena olivaceomarginata]